MAGSDSELSTWAARRDRIGAQIGGDVLILCGGAVGRRSNGSEHTFRPDSDFYYLTGLSEPGAVLVLRPGHEHPCTVFVRAKDELAERWEGRRLGPEGAMEQRGLPRALELRELDAALPKLIDGARHVYLQLGRYPKLQGRVQNAMDALARRNRWGDTPPRGFLDAGRLIGEDRIKKDAGGLACLRHAARITCAAHRTAMRASRPGMFEYEIEALLEYEFRKQGCTGPGYGSIVASGDNANILHYVENNAQMREGDLLLVDAGGSWDYFTADLTRTWPLSGTFSAAQREVYEIVLAANLAGIELTRVGGNIETIHETCVRVLCEGLISLGLFPGKRRDEVIESKLYERYYLHRTSHWLGLDVHDVGAYTLDRVPRPLEPGFVLTVEPGLYFMADDPQVPERFRGIGIRIEDDVLVTPDGCEVLTADAPKSVADIETWMAR